MGLLSRTKLLEKQELNTEKVELQSGDHVFVRQMTGRERDEWEKTLYVMKRQGKEVKTEMTLDDYRAKLAVYTVCDEKGELILEAEDYGMLSQNMSAKDLEAIADKASEINGIKEEDQEALLGNLEAVPDGNSTSDSQDS